MHSFLFVGNHKSQPTQDYSRKSNINNRDDFVRSAEQERQKRELNRKQLYASIKIQSFYRKILAQRKLVQLARERVRIDIGQLQSTSFNEENLIHLANLIKFGFKPTSDAHLMMSIIESSWNHRQAIVERLVLNHLPLKIAIAKILEYSVRCLSYFESIRLPTRYIEFFTDLKSYPNESTISNVQMLTSYFLRKIIHHNYYTQMCAVIQSKVPSNVSKTSRIHAIEPIVDLIARPVESSSIDSIVKDEALISLRNEFFSRSDLPAIPLLIAPLLVHRAQFPFVRYIELFDFTSISNVNLSLDRKNKLHQLHTILLIIDNRLNEIPPNLNRQIVRIIRHFIWGLNQNVDFNRYPNNDNDDHDQDDRMDTEMTNLDETELTLNEDCLAMLNKRSIDNYLFQFNRFSNQIFDQDEQEFVVNLAVIAHFLISYRNESALRSNFLMNLSTSNLFLRHLWSVCRTLKYETDYHEQVLLLSQISCANWSLKDVDIDRIEPLLVTFCSLYSVSLVPLHDDEFFSGPPSTAFLTKEISEMVRTLRDVCLGIVRFMYPDKKVAAPTNPQSHEPEDGETKTLRMNKQAETIRQRAAKFSWLFKIIVQLLQQLRSRDVRRRFCPPDYWLTNQFQLNLDRTYIAPFARGLSEPALLSPEKYFNPDRGAEAFTFSVNELRLLTILQRIPFVIPFDTRVQVFNLLIQEDKNESQRGSGWGPGEANVNLRIRRDYIYEDAFDKLRPENESNLRQRMRIHFVNAVGLDEAGIDGGGLFREFMNELLKSAFNPIRGLFKLTSDGYLYPNPNVAFIEENFGPHFNFLGRILGKAIYEKYLAELPFATFFLQKILSRSAGNVDIHHLASLDPEMYKNLLYLKNYDGNVEDLGLDFTIVNSEIGQTELMELKPNGRNISVTDENRIEYIHLVANYKLNRQINKQVSEFRAGLVNVIDLEWLRMFDANELRILISGSPGEINVADWKSHCQYRAPYSDKHPLIEAFWRCVEELTDEQKGKLLKFTTSCSRPPLFGFKELYPEFCIQSAGTETDRLPTSSTCINLLKLPEYPDETMLKEKLLYAIQAAAGFEFS